MFGVAILLVLCVVSIVFIWLEWRKWRLESTKLRNYQKLRSIPFLGVGGRFIGNSNDEVIETITSLFHECVQRPFYCWFGPVLMVGIDEPDDMQLILNADQCLDKPYMYGHLQNETGLLGSPRDIWKVHRRALNPTFNRKVLNSFIPTFNAKAKILADQLDRSVGTDTEIYRPLFKCMMDTIVSTALGMQWNIQNSRGDEYHDMFIEAMEMFNYRIVRFWLRWDFVFNLTKMGRAQSSLLKRGYQFLRGIREVKSLELAEKLDEGDDELLKSQLDNSLTWIQKCFVMFRDGKFDEKELIEEIDTAFVGGTDTTTVALTATFIMLAIHPEVQEKVVAELHEIFESPDEPITMDDCTKMTYTEMVIKESLRLYPVAPYILRECGDDFEFRGGVMPKGTIILLNILKMQKDQRFWGPNASAFDPEHFSSENLSKTHPYAFMAFSGGPRNWYVV